MRILIIAALSLGVAPSIVLAQDASLTRIEPRAFYGATVTLEEGVRVFRPLPPHRHIVINPGHKTPVNITLEDKVEHTTSTNYNYNYDQSPAYHGGGGGGGGFGGGAADGPGKPKKPRLGSVPAYPARGQH
jgi:hypothetical protein